MKTITALFVSIMAGAVIALAGGSCEGGGSSPAAPTTSFSALLERTMPSLEGATDWINTAPLDATELRGKVVLIDFWT